MNARRIFVGVVVGALLLGACSGSDRDASSSGAGKGADGAAESAPMPAAADSAGGAKAAPAEAQTFVPDPALAGRDVVTNATIGLQAKRVDAAASDAKAIVAAAGGYLFSENAAAGSRADAMLVFKVPPAAFDAVMDQLDRLGKRVSRQVTTDDVTAQVVDLEGRLASATGSMNRLRALYDRAESVGDVVAVEAELVRRESEVEALQGQLRVVESQVALATITLTVAKLAPAATTPADDASGFFAGLEQGWDALLAVTGAAATALGVVLPFLVLAALVGAVTLGIRRRLRLRPTAPSA
jgi:Domain of unknown function (DUF4349)